MILIHHNIDKLVDIKKLLLKLPEELFREPKKLLSDASIGQHFRHIFEFYTALQNGAASGTICYDDRERNELMETDVNFAISTVDRCIDYLNTIGSDRPMTLRANYATAEEQNIIQTSLVRELAYALDHTIHHLAIIKIALSKENKEIPLDSNFGVAPSTIRYKGQRVD